MGRLRVSFLFDQKITYWSVSASDGNGDPDFSAPVVLPAKWALKDGLVKNEKGEEIKTLWIIYTKQVIPKRSLIVLSESVAVTPPDGSREMVDNKTNPSFTNMVKSLA